MFDQFSNSNLFWIILIICGLIYLSVQIIKSSDSENPFTAVGTIWFLFIFFLFGGIIIILALVGFGSAMILLIRFLDALGWILIPLLFLAFWLVNRSK